MGKFKIKPWMIIVLIVGMIFSFQAPTEPREAQSRGFVCGGVCIGTLIASTLLPLIIGLFTKEPSQQEPTTPIWMWFAIGFAALVAFKVITKPRPVMVIKR